MKNKALWGIERNFNLFYRFVQLNQMALGYSFILKEIIIIM